MSARILVIKTGTTLADISARRGDFEEWIRVGMGLAPEQVDVVSPFAGQALPGPDAYAGVVVSGSSAMVSHHEPWSEQTARWLLSVLEADVPLLAICYGHQLLAHALGGEVGINPNGREIGTIEIHREPGRADPLMDVLPAVSHFQATHRESVLRLPQGAVRLAHNGLDPHHAFSLGDRAWGVQFHPEFDADVMRGYLEARRDVLPEEGLDPDTLLAAVRETPDGPQLLGRFAYLAGLG
jgi:GMP synthase (glutamine-hydrolysing)